MEMQQLEYFRVIASYGNLTKAAESLHITQPALSRLLRRLEADLGFLLFDRSGSGVSLTEEGEIFLKSVNQALNALNDGLCCCRDLQNKNANSVNVAFSYEALAQMFLPSFLNAHPDMSICSTLCSVDIVQEKLLARNIDFAICANCLTSPDIEWELLMEEELLLSFPRGHPFFGKRKIAVGQIDEIKLVFNESVFDRQSFREICRRYEIAPGVAFSSNDHQSVSQYIGRSGADCAFFVPASYFYNLVVLENRGEPNQEHYTTRIDPNVFTRKVGIAKLKGRTLPRSAELYCSFVKQICAERSVAMQAFIESRFT